MVGKVRPKEEYTGDAREAGVRVEQTLVQGRLVKEGSVKGLETE